MKIQSKTDISGKWVAIQDHEEALKESYSLGYQSAMNSLNMHRQTSKNIIDFIKQENIKKCIG